MPIPSALFSRMSAGYAASEALVATSSRSVSSSC